MPFSAQQFLDVFANYNEAVFPIQIVLLIAALVAVRLAGNGDTISNKTVAIVLGFFWLWMGVVYHWLFFSSINNLAFVFGGFFVLESVMLIYAGVVRGQVTFRQGSGGRRFVGTLLIVYALLIYPIIGTASGHSYPYSPTFGLPCPTTIFTFGLLVRSGRSIPVYILPVPVVWSFIGFFAVTSLGIWEDIGLLIAGLIGCTVLLRGHPRVFFDVRRGADHVRRAA
jgi:hypothetical protein